MVTPEGRIGLFATLRDKLQTTNNPNDLERAAIIEAMLQGRGEDLIFNPTKRVGKLRAGRETVSLDGAKVRQLRVGINIPQSQLAQIVGLSDGYVSLIENQKVDRVSKSAAEGIAKALNSNITDLRKNL